MAKTPADTGEDFGLGETDYDASTQIAEIRHNPKAQASLDRAQRRGGFFWLLMFLIIFLIAEQTSLTYTLYSYALGEFVALYPGENVVWLLTANALGGAVFLPLLTKIADVYGKKRTLVLTTLIVAAGALVCALAPTFGILIAGRVLMSAGAGLLTISMSLVGEVFPPKYRAISIGVIATGGGFFVVVGPLISAGIVSIAGMPAVFMFQLAIVLIAGLLTWIFLPASPITVKSSVDYLGALLLGIAAFGIIGGFSFLPTLGFSPVVIAMLVGGVVAALLCILRLRRAKAPLINLRAVARRATSAPIIAFCVLAAGFAIMSPLVILQWSTPADVAPYGKGLDQATIALWSIPMSAISVLTGFIVGKTVRSIGYRMHMVIGCLAGALSAALFALLPTAGAVVTIIIYAVAGFWTFASAASAPLVLLSVPEDQRTVALGVSNTASSVVIAGAGQIGYAILGLSIAGSVASAAVYSTGAYQIGYAVAAALCVCGALLSLRVPHGRPQRKARAEAAAPAVATTAAE